MTNDALQLSTETYFRPLGLHHFYDAFSLDGRLRKQWHQEQPKASPARTARRNRVPVGVIDPDQGEKEEGELEEDTSESSTDSEDTSDDQEKSAKGHTRTPLFEDIHQHGLMVSECRDFFFLAPAALARKL